MCSAALLKFHCTIKRNVVISCYIKETIIATCLPDTINKDTLLAYHVTPTYSYFYGNRICISFNNLTRIFLSSWEKYKNSLNLICLLTITSHVLPIVISTYCAPISTTHSIKNDNAIPYPR